MNDLFTDETTEKQLDEILQPLIDLLDETHQASENCDTLILIEIAGGQMYGVRSPYPDSVIIELPSGLHECKPLASMVATLLQQSGSDNHWFDDAEGEKDTYRTPLRFCIVKKTIWLPMEDRFSEGVHLMVDAVDLDPAAAESQVALLVDYLRDNSNLRQLTADEISMF